MPRVDTLLTNARLPDGRSGAIAIAGGRIASIGAPCTGMMRVLHESAA